MTSRSGQESCKGTGENLQRVSRGVHAEGYCFERGDWDPRHWFVGFLLETVLRDSFRLIVFFSVSLFLGATNATIGARKMRSCLYPAQTLPVSEHCEHAGFLLSH
jgi:hypothetical protein